MYEASTNSKAIIEKGIPSFNSQGVNESIAYIGNLYNSTVGMDSSAHKFIEGSD